MEVRELNQAIEEWEAERREQLMQWRFSNYINAAPYFDPNKATPKIEDWYPFPWDESYQKPAEFIPFDKQIELLMKRGKQDWIPDYWFVNSDNYKHLCRTNKSRSKE